MRKRLCLCELGLLVLVAFSPCVADEKQLSPREFSLERFEFTQPHMGTTVKLALYGSDAATANKAATAAFRRIEELESILSDYDSTSEVLRLCRDSGPGRPVKVSPELFFVLSRALDFSKQSDGAFDVTVGPLTKLWRRARRRRELPDPEKLAAARQLVGYQFVRLDPAARTVELLKPDMRLDFGGIGQGYAADEALRVLRTHGITRALVDASGDIVAGEAPPNEAGWRIAIRPLVPENSRTQPAPAPTQFFQLANAAVATSGDAFQFVEINGTRYSHVLDPRIGAVLTTRSSVTVIAPDGTTADALSTAVSVLGPERGLKLIEQIGDSAALIVTVVKDEPRTLTSSRFPTLRVAAPACGGEPRAKDGQ